jgi:hypothetical protein
LRANGTVAGFPKAGAVIRRKTAKAYQAVQGPNRDAGGFARLPERPSANPEDGVAGDSNYTIWGTEGVSAVRNPLRPPGHCTEQEMKS